MSAQGGGSDEISPIRRSLCLGAVVSPWVGAHAGAGLRLVYPRHAGRQDTLNGYAPELLALALARSGRAYQLAQSSESLPQGRAVVEMLKPRPPIDVFWTVTTPERERSLLPVRIPIERGLIGWRVALVRERDLERWRGLRELDELKDYSAGQKHDWPDVDILRSNGLRVQTTTQYEALFGMLELGRIDYFPRSVLEVQTELRDHAQQGLAIEPHVVLRYPSAMYFFVAPTRPELAADITRGLEAAQADGSFERLFREHFRSTIEALQLNRRRLLSLSNPNLPAGVPLLRRELWLAL